MQMALFFSPAKINLFLRVLGRRSDGYHELATVMQTLNFGDTLRITPAEEESFSCNDSRLSLDVTNLITRAVALFQKKTGSRERYHIHLDKQIPMKAGLGGGSSNAATTLWALNILEKQRISEEQLRQWGEELGADVPFFFSPGTAYCRGKGEQLRALPPLPFTRYHLYKPYEGVTTQSLFASLDLQKCSSQDPAFLLEALYSSAPLFMNDLTEAAFASVSSLSSLYKQLTPYHAHLWMTGSGTTLVGLSAISLQKVPHLELWGREIGTVQRTPGTWYVR